MAEADQAARTMRQLRERRGWSWTDLARALQVTARRLGLSRTASSTIPSIRRTVARWERTDRPTGPDEQYQLLLIHAYLTSPTGQRRPGPGSDVEEVLHAFASYGTPPDRIADLRRQATTIASDPFSPMRAGSGPAPLTEETIDDLHHAARHAAGQVGTVPFVRLQVQLAPVIQHIRQLLGQSHPTPIRTALCHVAADALGTAARFAFETRDDAAAAQLYRVATAAARELPDAWQLAILATSQAMITMYSTGNLAAATKLVNQAQRAAERSSSDLAKARAHALQAEMAVRSGQPERAAPALRLAALLAESDTTGDPGGTRFSTAWLEGFAGLVDLHAGNPRAAEQHLTHSAAGQTEGVQRSIILADLALARIRAGYPEAAAAQLHPVIDSAAATGARVTRLRIRDVRQALKPWRAEPFLIDLDDHLHAALLS